MQALSDLKEQFLKLGLELKFEGWFVCVGSDKWTMLDSQLYRNGVLFSEKELPAYLKELKANPPKLKKRTPKKITANRRIDNDSQSS